MAVVWATHTTLIQPLAQELPYATGAAVKKKKKKGHFGLPGGPALRNQYCHCCGMGSILQHGNFHELWVWPKNKIKCHIFFFAKYVFNASPLLTCCDPRLPFPTFHQTSSIQTGS